MAQWLKVAEGTQFWNLKQTVEDMDLPKGTKVRIVMDVNGFDHIFDMAGAELFFKPFVPDEMKLVDVWGENGQGIVELEAEGVWITAVIAGLPVWSWIVIAGLTLAVIIAYIVILVKVPVLAAFPAGLLIGAAVAIVGLTILASRATTRGP